MPERKLRQILDDLHQRLEGSPELDDDTQAALRGAAQEIQEALEEQREPSLADELRDQMGQAIARFESEHPKLTETLRRLVDQLAEMGI